MRDDAGDRALRRLVADLATASSADVSAVLAMLSPDECAQIKTLFDTYSGTAEPSARGPVAAEPLWRIRGLSPPITARLDASVRAVTRRRITSRSFSRPDLARRDTGAFVMTPRALEALQAAGLKLKKAGLVEGEPPASPLQRLVLNAVQKLLPKRRAFS